MAKKSVFIGLYLVFVLLGASIQAQSFSPRLILKEVNARRAQACSCGEQQMTAVPPLVWNERLARAAQKHADFLESRERFSHTGRRGSTVAQRVEAEGYQWMGVGENIAGGQEDEAEVVAGWMGSPGHCANIMNGEFTEMGVARSKKGSIWVQVLGRPAADSGK